MPLWTGQPLTCLSNALKQPNNEGRQCAGLVTPSSQSLITLKRPQAPGNDFLNMKLMMGIELIASISFMLTIGFMLGLAVQGAESERTLAPPVSNAKVQIHRDPLNGELVMGVDLFWTLSADRSELLPDYLLLFFQPPAGTSAKTTPRIEHLFIDGIPTENPEWIQGKGFVVKPSSPLYSGSKVHLEFQFRTELNGLPKHGILDNFFPRIPVWHDGQWVVPPHASPLFPYGTCHVISDAGFPLSVPQHLRRQASRNQPLVVNGISIVRTESILEEADLEGHRITFDPRWNEKDIKKALEQCTDFGLHLLYPHILVMYGPMHAGWGAVSASNTEELVSLLYTMALQTTHPLISSDPHSTYTQLAPFLDPTPEATSITRFLPRFMAPLQILPDTPLACFIANKPQAWLRRVVQKWQSSSSGQLSSLDDLFGLKQDTSTDLKILLSESHPNGFIYQFNVNALLVHPLFLEDPFGRIYLKPERTRVTEEFPFPLIGWSTGLSTPESGPIHCPDDLKKKAEVKKKRHKDLWTFANYQWLF